MLKKSSCLRLLFIASVCILHEHVYENATVGPLNIILPRTKFEQSKPLEMRFKVDNQKVDFGKS